LASDLRLVPFFGVIRLKTHLLVRDKFGHVAVFFGSFAISCIPLAA
jgi:hypothetical protein